MSTGRATVEMINAHPSACAAPVDRPIACRAGLACHATWPRRAAAVWGAIAVASSRLVAAAGDPVATILEESFDRRHLVLNLFFAL